MSRLISVAAFVALFALACFPGPDEPVEYLEREDTVVVQVRTVPPGVDARDVPPEFTLYGDGTLIYRGLDPEGEPALLRTELPPDAVRDLLEFAVDRGFLDLYYDQAGDGGDQAVTFLYVNTRGGTNSVRAVELDPESEGPGATVGAIVEHLRDFDPAAAGAGAPEPFAAERVVISAEAVEAFEGAGSPIVWPFGEIDLGTVAAGGDLVAEGDEVALELAGVLAPPPFATTVQQDGRLYAVSFRPLLPVEERFPEFDQ